MVPKGNRKGEGSYLGKYGHTNNGSTVVVGLGPYDGIHLGTKPVDSNRYMMFAASRLRGLGTCFII
jgi:hypothetical protein